MGFELLFEKGEETITGIEEGTNTYTISLKITNITLQRYSYQLLLFKSSLEQSLIELVKYTHDNGFQILQRDAILVDASEENIEIYELEIEIKNEDLRKVGTLHLSISNPDDINSYQTKFFPNFDKFDKNKEKE